MAKLTRAEKTRIIKDKLLTLFTELNDEEVYKIKEADDIVIAVNLAAVGIEAAIAIINRPR